MTGCLFPGSWKYRFRIPNLVKTLLLQSSGNPWLSPRIHHQKNPRTHLGESTRSCGVSSDAASPGRQSFQGESCICRNGGTDITSFLSYGLGLLRKRSKKGFLQKVQHLDQCFLAAVSKKLLIAFITNGLKVCDRLKNVLRRALTFQVGTTVLMAAFKGTAQTAVGGNRLFHPPLVYVRNTHLANFALVYIHRLAIMTTRPSKSS